MEADTVHRHSWRDAFKTTIYEEKSTHRIFIYRTLNWLGKGNKSHAKRKAEWGKKRVFKSLFVEFAEYFLVFWIQRTEYREQVNNHWLVELEQMTCNPVRGSQAGAPGSWARFSPIIKSPTWNGLLDSSLWRIVIPDSITFTHLDYSHIF